VCLLAGNRPIFRKRDIFSEIETSIYEMGPIFTKKRPANVTYTRVCMYTKKRAIAMKSDLHVLHETSAQKKRPTYMKRDLYMWKETCICGKGPANVTYTHVSLSTEKRTIDIEKRPIDIKRGRYTCKEADTHEKRPIHIKRGQYT